MSRRRRRERETAGTGGAQRMVPPVRADALPRVAEALLAWIPRADARFSVGSACHALVSRGYPRWEVGRLLRASALFHATARDVSLPDGFQQTSFRLSEEGRAAWQARRPARRERSAALTGPPERPGCPDSDTRPTAS